MLGDLLGWPKPTAAACSVEMKSVRLTWSLRQGFSDDGPRRLCVTTAADMACTFPRAARDTNGAGDAFVGSVRTKLLQESLAADVYVAEDIGCSSVSFVMGERLVQAHSCRTRRAAG